MKAEAEELRRQTTEGRTESREAESFLVRVWVEPSEGASATRGYLRNLRTGDDAYFADPRKLGELILRRMQQERQRSTGTARVQPLRPRRVAW